MSTGPSSPVSDEQLRKLIESVVEELLAKMGLGKPAPAPSSGPPVLFLLTGAANGHERVLECISCVSAKVPARAYIGSCYSDRFGTEALAAAVGCPDRVLRDFSPEKRDALVDRAAAVVFLLPMRSTVAKVSRAITDSAPSQMLTRALMGGKPVFCAGGEVDVAAWPEKVPEAMRFGKGSLGETVQRDLERLSAWGMVYRRDPMELCEGIARVAGGQRHELSPLPTNFGAAHLPKAAPSAPVRTFLTASDVRLTHQGGDRLIKLAPNCHVTDEARDVAAALHVTLSRE